MRSIWYGILLLLIYSFAFANDEPVPAGTHMTNLPEGSRILVQKNIDPGQRFYGNSRLERATRTIKAGEVLSNLYFYGFGSDTGSEGFHWNGSAGALVYLSGMLPVTVADFDRLLGSFFRIVYDDPAHYDPYPGMEKSMVVDIVMTKITAALKENAYAKALPQFAFLEKQGVSLPESFYYYYTDALEKTGKKDEARARASAYLKSYGNGGKYYAQIIDIMSRL